MSSPNKGIWSLKAQLLCARANKVKMIMARLPKGWRLLVRGKRTGLVFPRFFKNLKEVDTYIGEYEE